MNVPTDLNFHCMHTSEGMFSKIVAQVFDYPGYNFGLSSFPITYLFTETQQSYLDWAMRKCIDPEEMLHSMAVDPL